MSDLPPLIIDFKRLPQQFQMWQMDFHRLPPERWEDHGPTVPIFALEVQASPYLAGIKRGLLFGGRILVVSPAFYSLLRSASINETDKELVALLTSLEVMILPDYPPKYVPMYQE